MTRTVHGGDVYGAARDVGRAPDRLLDFSASINPLGPSPAVLRMLTRSRSLLCHYPDPLCWDLRQALAAHWRRAPEAILIGNGSTELIHLLPDALQIRHLLVVGPTFSEYAAAMARSGGRISTVMAEYADHYRPSLELVLEALRRVSRPGTRSCPLDAVLLCNPNSPTGVAWEATTVRTLARAAARLGLWCVVDETFADYCEAVSILGKALPPKTIVLRSFTKFYALPGLRVGYAVAHPAVTKQLSAQQPPWSVNMLAQRAAMVALRDDRHRRRSLQFMDRERTRLQRALERLSGVRVFPAKANFILLELPVGHKATQVVSVLRRRGVLLRDCSKVPGLNDRSLRVAVRTRSENDRLLKALSFIGRVAE
ncbi:threonine-phosphate decarboxylase CobD [Nitrospira defluvii]|uniref:threonine-phosphate decarboxylase n=1 Tax=Nitrospira defluvii TaxID=330214 RepID=A0ABM8RRH7_9BACT|nr:threonine-phosphate decarboxylase CobD [Nitrospira defluvii]CAE6767442.1 L-threonine 3-O-phosphate decarboxylase [Nitrospira defluvii]